MRFESKRDWWLIRGMAGPIVGLQRFIEALRAINPSIVA